MDNINENIEEENILYPEKPKVDHYETKETVTRSLWSLFIFMITFYIVFQSWVFVVMITLVLIVHEMGHFSFMKLYNYQNLSLRFIPFLGAYVSGNKNPISQREQTNILLAGPVPGILAGILLYFIGQQTQHLTILYLAKIFILINCFNLLPIIPLDGGRLLQNLYFNQHELLQKIFSLVSIILLTSMCVYLEQYILLIIPIFMFLQYRRGQKNSYLRQRLLHHGLEYRKSYEDLKNWEYWKIRDFLIENCPEFSDLEKQDYQESKLESLMISKMKNLLIHAPQSDLNFLAIFIYTLIWVGLAIAPFILFKSHLFNL